MKKNRTNYLNRMLILVTFLTLFIASNSNVMGQVAMNADGTKPASMNVVTSEYLKNNSENVIVKLYQANPGDADLANAVKVAMIIENPSTSKSLSNEELNKFKADAAKNTEYFQKIQSYIDRGLSYEMAKQRADIVPQKVQPSKQ